MNHSPQRLLWVYAFCLLAVIPMTTGCANKLFQEQATAELSPESTVVADQFYTMSVKSDWGSARSIKEPLPRPITVQEALERANAIPRFGNIEIVIHRVVPETGKKLIMKVDFDSEKDQVVSHQDYDIRPNDHILVRPASGSALDGLLNPLSKLTG